MLSHTGSVHQNSFSKEEYLNFFRSLCEKFENKKLLSNRIKEICSEMTALLSTISENSFYIFSKILGLDTQLQIIRLCIESADLEEEEILEMASEDYLSFMKESSFYHNTEGTCSIYFLVS